MSLTVDDLRAAPRGSVNDPKPGENAGKIHPQNPKLAGTTSKTSSTEPWTAHGKMPLGS